MWSILLVDDDQHTLQSIVNGLNTFSPGKYDIHTAGNANDAIKQLKKIKFDVVVTDLKMPSDKYEGFEVIRAVKEIDPNFNRTKVIVMTIVGDRDPKKALPAMRKALQMGVADYILKDWKNDLELLDKTMQKILLQKDQGIERSVINIGQVFVACPFDDHHDSLYKLLKEQNREKSFKFIRADDTFHGGYLKETIYKQIAQSEFVVAIVSGQNGNIMYELGLAHGMGKRVIMVKDQETEVITNLKSIGYLSYDRNTSFDLPNKIMEALRDLQEKDA